MPSDMRQVIERIAEEQARAVQRELDDIGIGNWPVSPHPECDPISIALYIDTKDRILRALMEAFAAQSAPSERRLRAAFEAGFCARPKSRESWVAHETNGAPREWEFSHGGSAHDLMPEAWQAWQNAVDTAHSGDRAEEGVTNG
jgi:hypothetical protein